MTKKKRGNSNKRGRKTKEEEYIVEEILGRRVNDDGIIEYKVRWKGYTSEDDTWEPEENCQTCPELIEEFEKGRANDGDNQDTDNEENSNDNRKRSRSTPDEDKTTKSRRNGRSAANRNYNEDTSDDEEKEVGKDSAMELDKSIASKDITVDDSDDDSLGFSSKHFDKENDASKIQPEFEIEEDDEDDMKLRKKNSPSDMFDEIMRKTNSVSSSNKDELVAEKIVRAGILRGGRIHFIVKLEGVEEPQTYAAEDAYRLFPQQVIAFYQSRVRWK